MAAFGIRHRSSFRLFGQAGQSVLRVTSALSTESRESAHSVLHWQVRRCGRSRSRAQALAVGTAERLHRQRQAELFPDHLGEVEDVVTVIRRVQVFVLQLHFFFDGRRLRALGGRLHGILDRDHRRALGDVGEVDGGIHRDGETASDTDRSSVAGSR